jgi:hypothetical protein
MQKVHAVWGTVLIVLTQNSTTGSTIVYCSRTLVGNFRFDFYIYRMDRGEALLRGCAGQTDLWQDWTELKTYYSNLLLVSISTWQVCSHISYLQLVALLLQVRVYHL